MLVVARSDNLNRSPTVTMIICIIIFGGDFFSSLTVFDFFIALH